MPLAVTDVAKVSVTLNHYTTKDVLLWELITNNRLMTNKLFIVYHFSIGKDSEMEEQIPAAGAVYPERKLPHPKMHDIAEHHAQEVCRLFWNTSGSFDNCVPSLPTQLLFLFSLSHG